MTCQIQELSVVCLDLEIKIKTQTCLREMKNLAKLPGQDYTDVLKGVISLLGQPINELCLALSPLKIPPDEVDLAVTTPRATSQTIAAVSLEPEDVNAANEELPQAHPDPIAHYTSRHLGPLPAMSFSDINPPGVQWYVVEHIMKSDDNAIYMSIKT